MKNKRVLVSLLLVVVLLVVTINTNTKIAYGAPVAVSTLNSGYIQVDNVIFRVLDTSGFATATTGTALGYDTWTNGLASIQNLTRNKSYIQESRYMTTTEWSVYKGGLGTTSPTEWWVWDSSSANFTFINTIGSPTTDMSTTPHGIRPFIKLKSTVTIESGTGTAIDPWVLQNIYELKVSDNIANPLTVVDGKPFFITVVGGDLIPNNSTSSGVTVINTSATDGYIQLSGTLTGLGLQVVTIGGTKFVFNKIAPVAEATITYSDSVAVLNGKYIIVDGVVLRVLNASGYAVAESATALGNKTWPTGFSAILGLANNKSYIKEARYMTIAEWQMYGGTLGVPLTYMWLQDSYHSVNEGSNFYGVEPYGTVRGDITISNCGIRPALKLESSINIQSGSGTLVDPYVLKSEYPSGGGGGVNPIPALTVVDGHSFNITVSGVDSIANGTALGGVTVTNASLTDGYIKLSGTLTGLGEQVITIDGIKFTFKIIAAPSGSTVTATFS